MCFYGVLGTPILTPETVPIPHGGNMEYLPLQSLGQPVSLERPHLSSLDPSEEFSLYHLMEVITLVEREEHDLDGYVFDDSLVVSQ